MKAVKFVKSYSPYVVGDIAGLPDSEADRAIKMGIAVAKNGEAEKKAEPKKEIKNPVATKQYKEAPVDKAMDTEEKKSE